MSNENPGGSNIRLFKYNHIRRSKKEDKHLTNWMKREGEEGRTISLVVKAGTRNLSPQGDWDALPGGEGVSWIWC